MISGKADLEAAKRAYAKAGFVYKGKTSLGSGRFKHVWTRSSCTIEDCTIKAPSKRRRTSRR
jgi:hypothetical protein